MYILFQTLSYIDFRCSILQKQDAQTAAASGTTQAIS